MTKGIIRLSYRKIIDASSQKLWDKAVFDDAWQEFYMQAQFYNQAQEHTTYRALREQVPGADKLPYLTSRAVIGYIRQLNEIVPDVQNSSGKLCLPFTQFTFEIVHAHVEQQEGFRIAILFLSEPLTWINTLNDRLLIAYGDQRAALREGQTIDIDLIALQPYLSVANFSAESVRSGALS